MAESKWQYAVLRYSGSEYVCAEDLIPSSHNSTLGAALNYLGERGWEAAGFVWNDNFVLKRPIDPNAGWQPPDMIVGL